MANENLFFLTSLTLGGLALFLLGMKIMTDGLRLAAGNHIRVILARATRNPFSALSLGTFLGFLVHSSAATVMAVGFVNAGLLSLKQSVPVLFGANVGTTLSMQLISLQLTDFAFLAIAVGFLLQMVSSHTLIKELGRAILGFGLLFLGMDTMSGAIEPYQDTLSPWFEKIDAQTWQGMAFGILVATAITAAIQSSGATIGMTFVMISAGVLTSLEQVYPIVLGAHLGTSVTALLASIGTNTDARRSAFANLFFNISNTILALLAAPLFLWLIPLTTTNLVHQTANLHMAIMLVAALILLPVIPAYTRMVKAVTPFRQPPPQPSFLQPEWIPAPEHALYASVQELGRAVAVCCENMTLCRQLLHHRNAGNVKKIRLNEQIINEINPTFKVYLATLSRKKLSRRQALFIQYLNHVMTDVERIGDHIKRLASISLRQQKLPEARFKPEINRKLLTLYDAADNLLAELRRSLDPKNQNFAASGMKLLERRNEYDEKSTEIQAEINDGVANYEVSPTVGLYFSEYAHALNRLVKHVKMIAVEQQQPVFGIKESKLPPKEGAGG